MPAEPLRLLYLGDPSSVHDLKWMVSGDAGSQRSLILRKCHYDALGEPWLRDWTRNHGIEVLGYLEDFSVVRPWRTWRQGRKLRRLVEASGADLFHVFFAEPNALWAVFRRGLGVPILVTTRGTDVLSTIPRFFRRRDLLGRLVGWLYGRAFQALDGLTSTSQTQIDSIRNFVPGIGTPIRLVRTGVDVPALEAHCTKGALPEIGQEKPYVLYPRLMRPIYDQELAIAAICQLPAKIREGYRFVFVGRDGADREYVGKIEQALEECPAETLFLEALDQERLHRALKHAAMVVMTPQSDGASVTAAEALLVRTPLVLPPLDYDSDIFGRGPFVFPERQPEAVAATMLEGLSGDWAERLEQGYQDALRTFDRQNEMGKLWEFYDALVSRRKI